MSDWYPGGAEWDECELEEKEDYYINFLDELKREFKRANLTPKK